MALPCGRVQRGVHLGRPLLVTAVSGLIRPLAASEHHLSDPAVSFRFLAADGRPQMADLVIDLCR